MDTFRRAVRLDPTSFSAWYNLGNTLLSSGEEASAVDPFERAAKLKPKDSETARLLAKALFAAGRPEKSLAALHRAQLFNPRNAQVYLTRAAVLHRMAAPAAEVIAQIDQGIALEPTGEAMRQKAAYLRERSRYAEAEQVLRDLLERLPDDVDTLLALGDMLGYALKRYEEANALLRRAVALRPGNARCLAILCKSLIDSRYGTESDHIEEAGKVAHELLATGADTTPFADKLSSVFLRLADFDGLAALGDRARLVRHWIERNNVGALHNQLGRVATPQDRRDLVRAHVEWGKKVEASASRQPIRPPAARPASRDRIRVGLMSSDLRNHPVNYFALPIFEHHDRARFELLCYSFYPAEADRVQLFVQKHVAAFRTMPQASNAEVAQRIADDDLDILFELGGSTRFNKLDVMAWRAAPLQASWLGYPHSAGLSTIDYILVDPYIKPDDPALLVERPFVMPESWVALGRLGFNDEKIELGLPEERNGALTFGTMNNPYKYTPALIALWAEVMRGVPGSRFLFVRPEGGAPAFRANICRLFEEHGVVAERIQFEAVRGTHLRHYNRIDIALDTAPHTGGTTTCETLWMGVPTVTLVGEAFFERLSYSNLTNAGLGDLCAFTPAQYVEIAQGLARDRARRADLRAHLRDRIRQLPLGDAKRWVRNFEATIERVVAEQRTAAAGSG